MRLSVQKLQKQDKYLHNYYYAVHLTYAVQICGRARRVAAEIEQQGLFLVHCGGRRLGLQLQGVEDKIWPAVKEVTKNTEFLMVFTFGEYGSSDHSANTVGGLSLSFTGFAK